MDKTTAIAELSALLKHRSDGYYLYLVNGGKNDPDVEIELEALDFAIRYLQDQESQRPKGRWVYDDSNLEWACSECLRAANVNLGAISGYILSDYCPNCGAKMEG